MPHCQASILRYTWAVDSEKNRIMFAHPADQKRQNLTVRLSYDEGRIGLIYEEDVIANDAKQTTIVFRSFSLDWLTDGQDRIIGR